MPVIFRSDSEPKRGQENNSNTFQSWMTNMSFTGADISATLLIPNIADDGKLCGGDELIELAELQTISYSIHRENTPVRSLGRPTPRGFVKGARTIAGSMIFTVFNEYAFYRIKQFRRILAYKGYAPLADMLPPFDVTLTFFNEYGLYSKMAINGITIVDEGGTMSIDDLLVEQTYTFMARGIQPMIQYRPDDELRDNISDTITNNVFGVETDQKFIRLVDDIEPVNLT